MTKLEKHIMIILMDEGVGAKEADMILQGIQDRISTAIFADIKAKQAAPLIDYFGDLL